MRSAYVGRLAEFLLKFAHRIHEARLRVGSIVASCKFPAFGKRSVRRHERSPQGRPCMDQEVCRLTLGHPTSSVS